MISVIVPFKDAEPWIKTCADSLHKQDGDFEFLFIDDGGADNSRGIIEGYDDPRIILSDNMRGKGVSGARNTGIELAAGEWVTFLDADDEMLPEAYKAFEDAIGFGCNICQFNHLRYYPTINKTAFKYINEGGGYSAQNLPKIWFGVWNKIYKADFVKGVRFNEKLNYGEDGLFILECLAKDNYIHHAPREVKTVRHNFVNPKSLSKHQSEALLFKYIRAMESFVRKQDDPIIRQAVCRIMSDEWKSKRFMEIIGRE